METMEEQQIQVVQSERGIPRVSKERKSIDDAEFLRWKNPQALEAAARIATLIDNISHLPEISEQDPTKVAAIEGQRIFVALDWGHVINPPTHAPEHAVADLSNPVGERQFRMAATIHADTGTIHVPYYVYDEEGRRATVGRDSDDNYRVEDVIANPGVLIQSLSKNAPEVFSSLSPEDLHNLTDPSQQAA